MDFVQPRGRAYTIEIKIHDGEYDIISTVNFTLPRQITIFTRWHVSEMPKEETWK